jgi:hypothetical protein
MTTSAALRFEPPAHLGAGPPAGRAPSSLLRSQETFSQVISRAQERPGLRTREQEARTSAEQLISIALIEPALKIARESSLAAPPFAPTPAEQQFRALLDSQRAPEIARAASGPLVERLMAALLTRSTPTPPPGSAGPGAFPSPALGTRSIHA